MEHHDVFTVTEGEIENLDVNALVALINQLIWNRALRIGLPIDQVHTTLRITQPDGGIDAITDLRGQDSDPFLGEGLMAWQFKKSWPTAESKPGTKTELERELAKPGVQRVFAEGGGYALVLGTGVPPSGRHGIDAKFEILKRRAEEAGCTGPVRLLAADKLASWASSDPAAVLSLRPVIQTYTSADRELHSTRHGVAFEPDDPRSAIIDTISTALFGASPTIRHYHIQGLAGVGKTRLALEIARHAGLVSQTLYSSGVPSLDLFNWVAANDHVWVNLIVDECETAQGHRLAEVARPCNGRLRLITVGPGTTRGERVFVLDPMSVEAMERVVTSAANLPHEQVRWVAEKTRGYVKLAVLVARAIARGTRTIVELGNDWAIADLVKNLLVPTEEGRRALQGIALLSRVGFQDEVVEEGRAIAAFMGLEWLAMRQLLDPAQQQGIVVTRGRYWYVSPELLAIWLAGEVWRARGDEILTFNEMLPGLESRTAFYERLASLREFPEVERVAADLLGPSGPFDRLASIDDPRTARVFSVLAKSHPTAALRSLQRMLEPATREDLLNQRGGRRELVWVLERLAQYRETFFGAARLLRRLAEAENETYGNNATGVWGGLFQTLVAPTEVPALDRLVLIDEAMADSSPAVRRLAAVGLAAALIRHEYGVLPSPDVDVPPTFWQPRTWGEVREVKQAALGRLASLLGDPDAEVAEEARKVLRERIRDLVLVGLAEDVLSLLQQWEPADDAARRSVWDDIQWVVRHAQQSLTDDQRQAFERLADRLFGASLSDRLKRYLGPGMFGNWSDDEAGEPSPESVSAALAEEAVGAEEEFEALLPWLFSGDASLLWDFALRLGELDTNLAWLDRLRGLAGTSQDPRLLSGYLIGHANATGEAGGQWRAELLDAWASDQRLALAVFDATMRGDANDRAATRLLALVDRGWVDARLLGWLRQPQWVKDISTAKLGEIVDRLIAEASTVSIAAGLGLFARLTERGTDRPPETLEARAWHLLEHPAGWVHETEVEFYWKTVARSVLATEPLRVAALVLSLYREGDPAYEDPRLELLTLAAQDRPQEVWAAVGEELMQPQRSLRLRWDLTGNGFARIIPAEVIEAWVTKRGPAGAKVVAGVLKVPDEPELPQVARFLVGAYGADVGDILLGTFMSGSWVGSETDYLEGKPSTARRWMNDIDPGVRSWADRMCQYLEARISEARVRDEEESLT